MNVRVCLLAAAALLAARVPAAAASAPACSGNGTDARQQIDGLSMYAQWHDAAGVAVRLGDTDAACKRSLNDTVLDYSVAAELYAKANDKAGFQRAARLTLHYGGLADPKARDYRFVQGNVQHVRDLAKSQKWPL